jgi:Ulp1 family protease
MNMPDSSPGPRFVHHPYLSLTSPFLIAIYPCDALATVTYHCGSSFGPLQVDVFACKYVFFPTPLYSHWTLFVVDMTQKTIWHFDSFIKLKHSYQKCFRVRISVSCFLVPHGAAAMNSDSVLQPQALKRWLVDEMKAKKGEHMSLDGWKTISTPAMRNRKVPQQRNQNDCGVFMCQAANVLTRDFNGELDYSGEDMPYFRARMMFELFKGKLCADG